MDHEWTRLQRSERICIGDLIGDVWATGDGARFTVINGATYTCGGRAADIEQAKAAVLNHIQLANR